MKIQCGYYMLVLFGEDHSIYIVLTDSTDEKLYSWDVFDMPQLRTLLDSCCGAHHTIFLTQESKGNCYGVNFSPFQDKELPSSNTILKQMHHLNHPLLLNTKVVQCAAGYRISIFLDINGNLYSSGCNDDSTLFRGKGMSEDLARVDTIPCPITRIWCGYRHAMVFAGEQYLVCGFSGTHQLDMVSSKNALEISIEKPRAFKRLFTDPLFDVQLGGFSTVFVTSTNKVHLYCNTIQGELNIMGSTVSTLQITASVGANHIALYYPIPVCTSEFKFKARIFSLLGNVFHDIFIICCIEDMDGMDISE
jgi:alpha-tubulin suppressor-like RCC1 family protein